MRHVSTVADAPFDKALGIQLIVGAHHAVTGNAQRRGQVTAGRQSRATGQTSIKHPQAQRLIELATQALTAIKLDTGRVEGQKIEINEEELLIVIEKV